MKRLAPLVLLLVTCGEAAAHGSAKGLGDFFGGAVHPLIEPIHLIAIAALGLLIGQRGLDQTRPAALCFACGSAIGLALAGMDWTVDTDVALLALSALAGVWVAASAGLPRLVGGAGAALLGMGIGLGSRPEASSGGAMIAALIGTWAGASAWMLNLVVLVTHLKRPWMQILVRVVGSWAAASSVLVLALWISGKHALPPAVGNPLSKAAASLELDTKR